MCVERERDTHADTHMYVHVVYTWSRPAPGKAVGAPPLAARRYQFIILHCTIILVSISILSGSSQASEDWEPSVAATKPARARRELCLEVLSSDPPSIIYIYIYVHIYIYV